MLVKGLPSALGKIIDVTYWQGYVTRGKDIKSAETSISYTSPKSAGSVQYRPYYRQDR